MGLLIRYDPAGAMLRSVGDPPNGVITIVVPDGEPASFAIDGSYEFDLSRSVSGAITIERKGAPGGVPDSSAPVDVGALLDACETPVERALLLNGAVACIRSAADHNAQADVPLLVEYLQSHVDFLALVRDALVERGMLRFVEPDDG